MKVAKTSSSELKLKSLAGPSSGLMVSGMVSREVARLRRSETASPKVRLKKAFILCYLHFISARIGLCASTALFSLRIFFFALRGEVSLDLE